MEKATKRLDYNLRVLELLKTIFLSYPDLRFNQVIWSINNGENCFNEEPEITLEKIKKYLKK